MGSPLHLLDFDSLCCHEDHFWVETSLEDHGEGMPVLVPSPALVGGEEQVHRGHFSCYQLLLVWDDEELRWLSVKEKEERSPRHPEEGEEGETFASWARKEAARWVVRASARLGFTAQTALLAVDYLDRFLSQGQRGERRAGERQPWMAQLTAVACLSLAAKVEETHVPLLLDLQVEETRFVFEARTIQRMELLLLSTLGWRMSPVTPLSYIDHIVRRMATNTDKNAIGALADAVHRHPHMHWEFQRRCHSILLSLVADPRWLQFLPSVMAAAAMLHALFQFDLLCSGQSSLDLENQILTLLDAPKGEVEVCYLFVLESMATGDDVECGATNKRKYSFYSSASSPKGVIDSTFSCDSSSDSWAVGATLSVSSSPEHPLLKRPNTGIAIMADDGGPISPFGRVFV